MTLHQLEDMLSKGAEPTDTNERLEQFVLWRIQEYNENKWDALSDIFAEEFQQFAKEDFETLSKKTLYGLRNCLRANGVYVKKGRGVLMSESLANIVQEDIPWPLNDEDRPPPKQQQYYPPQQQTIQPQQPYRPENTVPLPPQPAYHQPYRPENTIPLPPQPPYRPENPAPILLLTSAYDPNYRVPHLLPTPYQVIQDFDTK